MSEGTYPAHSQWRTIRIPSCSTTTPSICGKELLPKPCPTCCAHSCDEWTYSLVDNVEVPAELAPGDYTLSWRWDAEINHQVWYVWCCVALRFADSCNADACRQNCADLTVKAGAANSSAV
jgi:hypothetical protein